MNDVNAHDDQIDSDRVVSRVLATIPTYKKRLAYYLYLHNVPAKSKTEHSIAKACGVSERTVRAWIEEIENDLKQNQEVQQQTRGKRRGEWRLIFLAERSGLLRRRER